MKPVDKIKQDISHSFSYFLDHFNMSMKSYGYYIGRTATRRNDATKYSYKVNYSKEESTLHLSPADANLNT